MFLVAFTLWIPSTLSVFKEEGLVPIIEISCSLFVSVLLSSFDKSTLIAVVSVIYE